MQALLNRKYRLNKLIVKKSITEQWEHKDTILLPPSKQTVNWHESDKLTPTLYLIVPLRVTPITPLPHQHLSEALWSKTWEIWKGVGGRVPIN